MRVHVAGNISAPEFHQCCSFAKECCTSCGVVLTEKPLLETEWERFLEQKQQLKGGAYYKHSAKYVVLADGAYVGAQAELQAFLSERFPQLNCTAQVQDDWKAVARSALKAAVRRPLVYFDVGLGGKPERVVFELYSESCPRACNNFRQLCTSKRGGLTYLGTPFHRVVPGGWVQGGDVVGGSGDQGTSVFGAPFEDETYDIKFDAAGVLAMANNGPHTNASQFFVSLAPLPWMDCRAVAFGRVVRGMGALRRLEAVPTLNQRPQKDVKIVGCGEMAAEDL